MEMDFMGLSSRNPIVVKEEIVEGPSEDSGFGRSSGVPWLLPAKPLALFQFSSVKSEQSEKLGKNSPGHFLGRIPTVPVIDKGVKSKAVNPSAQLTIFYGGAVTVFDEITPEKAQAIICMAGKGAPKVVVGDPAPTSGHRSHTSTDSTNPPPPANDCETVKVEPPKLIPSASAMISSAVPQARKASLVRFLEKRKERAMSAAPYTMTKKSPEQREVASSAISGAGSTSGKEIADDV